MNNPLHEIRIPINKPVNAQFIADLAKDEWQGSIRLARRARSFSNPERRGIECAYWLADAAEWRRVYQACKKAVSVMGGL